jgi:hypothetical protein
MEWLFESLCDAMVKGTLMNQAQALELMQQVDYFYNNSWQHLMLYVTFLGAIVGLLVPGLTYLFQKRLFTIEESRLSAVINSKIAESRTALLAEVTEWVKKESQRLDASSEEKAKGIIEKVESRVKEIEMKSEAAIVRLEQSVAQNKGSVYHVQMNMNVKNEQFQGGYESGVVALSWFRAGKDELNFRRVAQILTSEILPKLSSEDLKSAETGGANLLKLLDDLRTGDQVGRYYDLALELRRGYDDAKARGT